jgi:hypothetical protein
MIGELKKSGQGPKKAYRTIDREIGHLRWVINTVAHSLSAQDNILVNTEETRTHIHAWSVIRTHDPSVSVGVETYIYENVA